MTLKALILEGGAMRSVHSAGALVALNELGFAHDYFDLVLGASAGACNGAYFLANQTNIFWDLWTKTILSKEFLNFNNVFTTKPILDLDFSIFEVMTKRHKLDLDKILTSKSKFYVVATNCDTGKPEYILNNKAENFFDILKASSAIPILYNKTVKLNNQEYMDGSITDSIPIKKAIEMGATEICLILTRHEKYKKHKSISENITSSLFKNKPMLKQAILERHICYNECLKLIETGIKDIKLTVIRPKYNTGITRTTQNPRMVKSIFQMGYYDAMKTVKK